MKITRTLRPLDYVVLAAILVVSASIGVFYGFIKSRQKTTQEFLLANKEMTVLPVSLSLLASFMSAITLLGTPAEIYVYGTQYWMIWIAYCFVIPLSAHVFIPVFYNLKITSVFEYLDLRFHCRGLRVLAAVIYIVQMMLYMAVVLYAPSLALNAVTGLNVWISVCTVGLVCTFYTALGGMKAVMWTDVFQIVMMFIGLCAVLIQGAVDFGFSTLWKRLEEGHRVEFFNFSPDPFKRHTVWTLSLGGAFTWLVVYGVNQAQVQRTLCTPTLKQAQIAMWINLPGLTALLTICSLCGVIVYGQYHDCDPLSTNRITARDQLLPLYVMDTMNVPGVPGLFTACIFSGALSTLSSGFNSLSAVTLEDMVKYLWFHDLTDSRATVISKVLSVVYGILCILLTVVASQLGGVLQAAFSLFGMIGGPLLGLYILGMMFPWANYKGACAGVVTSLILTLWLGIGANVYKPFTPIAPVSTQCLQQNTSFTTAKWHGSTTTSFNENPALFMPNDNQMEREASNTTTSLQGYFWFYEVSYLWYSGFAVLVVQLVGLPISFLTGANRHTPVDSSLMCPIFDVFCCCLPQNIRHWLQCHIQYQRKPSLPDTKKSAMENHRNAAVLTPSSYVNPALSRSSLASTYSIHSLQYETSV